MKLSQKTMRTSLVLMIMVLVTLALYYHLSNKMKPTEETDTMTAVQSVLVKDLDREYPATPREVLKYYNQILKCLYNEEYSEEEFNELADKAEELYDTELIANQTQDQYISGLKAAVDDYKTSNKKLSNAWVASSTDVSYYTVKDRDCANMRCIYTVREGTSTQNTNELYVFRKDENGHWKILGWQLDNGNQEETEES